MNAHSQTQNPNNPPRKRRLIGAASNVLLLGFLAGMFAGNSLSASTMTWATTLTMIGLGASVVLTKVSDLMTMNAKKKACKQAISKMERRMERLIPKGRVIAHGTHAKGRPAHSPHTMEDSENDWMPVARRGRAGNIQKF